MAVKMLWKEKEKSRIKAIQMDNFRGLLVPNAWIKELCIVTRRVDKKIDGLFWIEWRMIG